MLNIDPNTPVVWRTEASSLVSYPGPSFADDLDVRKRGKLMVQAKAAKELFDTSLMGRQSPFVQLQLGNAKVRSFADKSSGERATWNQNLELEVLGDFAELQLEVWSEGVLKNDLIGSCSIPLWTLIHMINPSYGSVAPKRNPDKEKEKEKEKERDKERDKEISSSLSQPAPVLPNGTAEPSTITGTEGSPAAVVVSLEPGAPTAAENTLAVATSPSPGSSASTLATEPGQLSSPQTVAQQISPQTLAVPPIRGFASVIASSSQEFKAQPPSTPRIEPAKLSPAMVSYVKELMSSIRQSDLPAAAMHVLMYTLNRQITPQSAVHEAWFRLYRSKGDEQEPAGQVLLHFTYQPDYVNEPLPPYEVSIPFCCLFSESCLL